MRARPYNWVGTKYLAASLATIKYLPLNVIASLLNDIFVPCKGDIVARDGIHGILIVFNL